MKEGDLVSVFHLPNGKYLISKDDEGTKILFSSGFYIFDNEENTKENE